VIPEPTSFNGDDTRDLSSGPGDPHKTFRRNFRLFRQHGKAEAYVAIYRSAPFFAADVEWADRQLLIELDVLAGEVP
jgi:hypothetical protein